MKKILFGLSVFLSTLISAQNYPDYYPSNTNNSNSNYYGDDEDSYYFPDDYYYEYPSDYYTGDFYQSSYNDYRSSIYDVNWNRFFSRNRLSSWQIQQIMMLNDSYPSYNAWNNYYRYNPDRWYYDRFYALENILGPRIFVIFQNNYYNGYNPVAYYQNYRRQHYVTNIYVVPRYRNINVNRYRVDRKVYSQNNPRQNFGFQDTPRNGNGGFRNSDNVITPPKNGGFRNDAADIEKASGQKANGGFRNNAETPKQNPVRIERESIKNNQPATMQNNAPKSDGGFRNSDSGLRNSSPERKIDRNSQKQQSQPAQRSSSAKTGMRFTGR